MLAVRARDVEYITSDPLRIHRGQHRHVDQSVSGEQERSGILGEEHGGIQEVSQPVSVSPTPFLLLLALKSNLGLGQVFST